MINSVTQKTLMVPTNPAYKQALDLIQQIKQIKSTITTNVWQLACILNKVWQNQIWKKAGFLSFYHFLSSAGLRPNAIMLSVAASVFTEQEFTFLGESKARASATAIRTHPDKKDEIMALAQSCETTLKFKESIAQWLPEHEQSTFHWTYQIKGPKEQIEIIKHMIDVIIATGVVNPEPAEVIEFALLEFYNEIKKDVENVIDIPALETKIDELTGINSK
jgi:hypothetical protein